MDAFEIDKNGKIRELVPVRVIKKQMEREEPLPVKDLPDGWKPKETSRRWSV